MEKESGKLFYINVFDGIVKEGKIIENDKDGIWIKLNGESLNTFVFFDMVDKRIFKQREKAETTLAAIRADMKERLLRNNIFIDDICEKLEKQEGKLYVGIVREILLNR